MSRYPIILLLLVAFSRQSFAFDPFSIIAAASAVASGISAVTGAIGDVASTVDAFGDLYSEIDSDAQVNPESKRLIEKVKEIENTAAEIGYTEDEISHLLKSDKESAQDLEKLVKKLTQAIRTGKKLSALFHKLEKKAQAAEVEQLSVAREQLKLQHRLLNEQIENRLDRRLEKLRSIKEHQASLKALQKELRDRGALVFGKTGIFCFPKKDKVLQKSIEFAKRTAPLFAGLILLAFLLRLLFYQFGFSGAHRYGDLIRDALVCMFLLATFGQIVEAALGISDSLSDKIAFGKATSLQQPAKQPAFHLTSIATSTALTLEWIGTWTRYLLFIIADFVFNFGLAFVVFLFPLVIFVSQMLNFPIAWPVFLSSFLLLTLWPVFWNATGALAAELWVMDTESASDMIKSVLFSILQLISPFVSLYLLKGQSLPAAVTSYISSTAPVTNFVKGAFQAARQKSGGSAGGRMIGATGRWASRQAAGRVTAGYSRYNAQPEGSARVAASVSGFLLNERTAPSEHGNTAALPVRFVRGFKNPKSYRPKNFYRPSRPKKS